MNFRESLIEEWENRKNDLKAMNPNDDGNAFMALLNQLTETEKLLTSLEKTEMEIEERAISQDIDENVKIKQMEIDKKDKVVKWFIEAGRIVIPLTVAGIVGVVTAKIERYEPTTTTARKNSHRDLINFKIR